MHTVPSNVSRSILTVVWTDTIGRVKTHESIVTEHSTLRNSGQRDCLPGTLICFSPPIVSVTDPR